MSIQGIQSGPRMSQAVVFNKTVYLAGQVADGPSVTLQTKAIVADIDRSLAQAGFRMEIAVVAAQA